ncbi:hypothetical protein [Streptomyces wuyuanensis]|uniref:hypothetical protein n=1 Tax=Streptomyces wuyuanensis TaxID=1196353 RepID=UPI003418C599
MSISVEDAKRKILDAATSGSMTLPAGSLTLAPLPDSSVNFLDEELIINDITSADFDRMRISGTVNLPSGSSPVSLELFSSDGKDVTSALLAIHSDAIPPPSTWRDELRNCVPKFKENSRTEIFSTADDMRSLLRWNVTGAGDAVDVECQLSCLQGVSGEASYSVRAWISPKRDGSVHVSDIAALVGGDRDAFAALDSFEIKRLDLSYSSLTGRINYFAKGKMSIREFSGEATLELSANLSAGSRSIEISGEIESEVSISGSSMKASLEFWFDSAARVLSLAAHFSNPVRISGLSEASKLPLLSGDVNFQMNLPQGLELPKSLDIVTASACFDVANMQLQNAGLSLSAPLQWTVIPGYFDLEEIELTVVAAKVSSKWEVSGWIQGIGKVGRDLTLRASAILPGSIMELSIARESKNGQRLRELGIMSDGESVEVENIAGRYNFLTKAFSLDISILGDLGIPDPRPEHDTSLLILKEMNLAVHRNASEVAISAAATAEVGNAKISISANRNAGVWTVKGAIVNLESSQLLNWLNSELGTNAFSLLPSVHVDVLSIQSIYADPKLASVEAVGSINVLDRISHFSARLDLANERKMVGELAVPLSNRSLIFVMTHQSDGSRDLLRVSGKISPQLPISDIFSALENVPVIGDLEIGGVEYRRDSKKGEMCLFDSESIKLAYACITE